MKAACLVAVIVLALGACGSRAPKGSDMSATDSDQWVCQPDGDAWACDQGTEPTSEAQPN